MCVRLVLSAWMLAAFAALMPVAALAADPPAIVAPPAPDQPSCPPLQPMPRNTNPGDLWSAQDILIERSLARLPPGALNKPNIYAVAVAPLGTQTLFSREAKVALEAFATNYGGTARCGILLSNGAVDLMKVPLATQKNMALVLSDIGRRTQAMPDDILLIYLTSHGRQDAALGSALPGNVPILAISAESLATALDQAQIRRRIIIISACFAGSWIPRLANDDTIILTAAAADRTSFGCADDRPLTYFGEAFLTGPLSRGASLAEAFEGAKKTVSGWEAEQKLLYSLPQMFVGKNMQKLWVTPVKLGAKLGVTPGATPGVKVAAKPGAKVAPKPAAKTVARR